MYIYIYIHIYIYICIYIYIYIHIYISDNSIAKNPQTIQFKNGQSNYTPIKMLKKKWTEDLNRHFSKADIQMLNITNHQGNANQNHNEISPHTC